MKVEIEAFNTFVYPDILVFCGERKSSGKLTGSLNNPTVVIEILSDSTENKDRKSKFRYYRSLPSFKEYILVDQYKPLIESFYRESDTKWDIRTIQGIHETVKLNSLGISIPLEDIYDGVAFKK